MLLAYFAQAIRAGVSGEIAMRSPFPGMDPYLENPALWPEFHNRLAESISSTLNRVLPPPYYAQLGARQQVSRVGETVVRSIVPHVSVHAERPAGARDFAPSPSAGVAAQNASKLSPSIDLGPLDEPQELNFVEIRDPRLNHAVVTLIEILSPANKLPGPDREQYIAKRNEVLASKSSLIEIDLLRAGDRTVFGSALAFRIQQLQPPPEYLVLINRYWKRSAYELFPIYLKGPLPTIVVPLQSGEQEVCLNLQQCFDETYERGPYRRGAVDYTKPPDPPLKGELAEWAKQRVAQWLQKTAG